jgi:hypothetical protein
VREEIDVKRKEKKELGERERRFERERSTWKNSPAPLPPASGKGPDHDVIGRLISLRSWSGARHCPILENRMLKLCFCSPRRNALLKKGSKVARGNRKCVTVLCGCAVLIQVWMRMVRSPWDMIDSSFIGIRLRVHTIQHSNLITILNSVMWNEKDGLGCHFVVVWKWFKIFRISCVTLKSRNEL